MNQITATVLAINGGSSSIKFALYNAEDNLREIYAGKIEGIGLPQGNLSVVFFNGGDNIIRPVAVPDSAAALNLLMDWLDSGFDHKNIIVVGHRIVHGGPKYSLPQLIDADLLSEIRSLDFLDPEHLPGEISIAQALLDCYATTPQIACFDTAFHQDLPNIARLLAIPRRFAEVGIKRYGFHGLSCSYLVDCLAKIAGTEIAHGKLVIAHLGSGASITAVSRGKSVDTSMGLTPSSGIPMSTRSGDLDPGVASYLAYSENISAQQFQKMVNSESGLLGISESSSDMRELLLRESADFRAAEAIALFCYQTKKWICGLAGALGGLDTLIFSGGIGENMAEIRTRICSGLGFIGLELDQAKNLANAPVISSSDSAIAVRVIRTNEELEIARNVQRWLKTNGAQYMRHS